MKRWAVLLFAMSLPAAAQTADALYQQACGPKDAKFVVQRLWRALPPTEPESGKALVFFIQKASGPSFTTRVGLDGAWVGMVQHDSYVYAFVTPGEHHACAATTSGSHPLPELVHFTAEAGKVYYYLLHGFFSDYKAGYYNMEFGPADRDEALYLIAIDPQSVTKAASLEQ